MSDVCGQMSRFGDVCEQNLGHGGWHRGGSAGWTDAMNAKYVCRCGQLATAGAYSTRDIRDEEPVFVFCGDCTPYLADLPPHAAYMGALPSMKPHRGEAPRP